MKPTILIATLLLAAAGCTAQTEGPAVSETQAAAPAPIEAPHEGSPIAATAAGSATKTASSATRDDAAASSLRTLAHLVTPDKTLGFHSTSEVSAASLETPLPMLMVGLNSLRAYRAGDDPRPLLRDEGSTLYPVSVGGDVRSAVVVRKVGSGFKATQFGKASTAKFAHEGRRSVAAARGVAASGMSLVEIPTMSTRMLEHEEGGVPMLTALLDVPRTDIRAGATLPAADVFAKLQPLAALNDGKTPN